MTDIQEMTTEQIREMEERIQAEKKIRIERLRAEARDKIQAILDEAGMSLNEIFPGRAVTALKVKYRNPENPDETWAGAGRRPAWLNAKLEGGAKLEDFQTT